MPDIVITSSCNLHCPYCYAQQMMQKQNIENISIKRFDEILEWIRPYAEKNRCRIGIFGGEPTLHPEFETIMEHTAAFCKKYNTQTILFTNGICLTPDIIKTIPDNMKILINCNYSSGYQEKDLNQFHNNLDFLYSIGWLGNNSNKITLGLTMSDTIDDYSFYNNLIQKYNQKYLRIAIDMSQTKFLIEQYNLKMKNYFLNLIDFCLDNNIYNIGLGCHIPLHIFNLEEQQKLFKIIPKEKYIASCFPEYKIYPNFDIIGCFVYEKYIKGLSYKNYNDFLNKHPFKVGNYYE